MNFTQEHLAGRVDFIEFYRSEGVSFRGNKPLCPFHDDQNSSFSIDKIRGLFNCHGCGVAGDPVIFLQKRRGLTEADAIAELRRRYGVSGNGSDRGKVRAPRPIGTKTYEIRDTSGKTHALHKRTDFEGGEKTFSWLQPDGTSGLGGIPVAELPLYGSERIKEWDDPDAPIILAEGEKACDALVARGYYALATVTGASGTPSARVLEILRDWNVVLWPDNDKPGRSHMNRIAALLAPIARSVRILPWGEKPKDDAADLFERGGSEEQLDRMLAEAPAWVPSQPKPDVVCEPTQGDPEPQGENAIRRLVVSYDEFIAEREEATGPSLWGDALLVKGGGYLIVGGDTGVGKTILVSNLLFALAAGMDEFLGFPLPGRPVPVLFLEAEGSRHLFRKRLVKVAETLGVSRTGLPIFFHERNAPLSIAGDSLSRMIEQSEAELAFLDPVGRFYSGNENLTDDWRGMVANPLAQLAASHFTAFAVSDHYSKPNEARSGQHKIRGSAAKVQDCGAALRLEIGRAGGGSRILFFDRVRDGALPFPEREPSRMALSIDVAKGTISRGPREDEESPLLAYREARVADVVETVRAAGPEIRTADLVAGLSTRTGLEKSRANDLIASAVACRAIERARRGVYQLPGGLLTEASA